MGRCGKRSVEEHAFKFYLHLRAVGGNRKDSCMAWKLVWRLVNTVCVVSVDKVVNCRGGHVAGGRKCPVSQRQVEVARVRVVQKVSYAEAVKKAEEDGSRVRDPESSRSVLAQSDSPTTDIQCIRIVFRPLDFFHILLHYGLILKSIYTQYPIITKQKHV